MCNVHLLQSDELMNTAVLTGLPQNHAMQVYAIAHAGGATEVTSQTTCHSGDDTVLKVSVDH